MFPLVESTKYWGYGPAVELAAPALLALCESMLGVLAMLVFYIYLIKKSAIFTI